MSYFISQETDLGFRVDAEDFLRRLRAAWPDSEIRPITDPKRKYCYEWTLSTKTGQLEGKLERLLVGVVLDAELASAAEFAIWFQREIARENRDLKFYSENYDPVVVLTNETLVADIIRIMS